MKTRISLFMSGIILILLACNSPDVNSQSTEPHRNMFATANEKAMPAVVKVNIYDINGKLFGNGSGVIVEDGYILTNYHVIKDAHYIGVVPVLYTDADVSWNIPVNLIGYDPLTDVAILKTSDPVSFPLPQNTREIGWGNSDEIQVGEWAIALGYPYAPIGETHPTVTIGVVSAIRRTMSFNSYRANLIQTDAPINRGNSGGALVNIKGQLIGINTVKVKKVKSENSDEFDFTEGLGFAVPVNAARNVINQIKVYGCMMPSDLGMETRQVTEKSTSYSLHGFNEVDVSVHVSAVKENGAAADAGIKAGDHILAVRHPQGTETIIVNEEHFKSLMHIWPIDEEVTLAIVRNKKVLHYFSLQVKRIAPKLRMMVRQPNPKNLQKYQNRGVIVENVDSLSFLADVLGPGDLLYKIGVMEVRSLEEFKNCVPRLTAGEQFRFYFERNGKNKSELVTIPTN